MRAFGTKHDKLVTGNGRHSRVLPAPGPPAAPTVDIGVACRDKQSNNWWVPLLTECITLTKSGVINFGRLLTQDSAMADVNQSQIVKWFLDGPSEWLYMIEDDTVHPKHTLPTLLQHGRPWVSGLYYYTNVPHNPIAYFRNTPEDEARDPRHVVGTYFPPKGWDKGEIFEVDSVGLGCCVIHRSVFEKIKEAFVLKMDARTSELYPIHKADLWDETLPLEVPGRHVYHNAMIVPLRDPPEGDERPWPFFAFHNGRTQDHYFAEMAARVGVRPLLDTSIECTHWKDKPTGGQHHRAISDHVREAEYVRS